MAGVDDYSGGIGDHIGGVVYGCGRGDLSFVEVCYVELSYVELSFVEWH